MAVNFVIRCKAKDLVEAIKVAWEQNIKKTPSSSHGDVRKDNS